MPNMVAAKLEPLARLWTVGKRENFPLVQRTWQAKGRDPKVPMWPLPNDAWRVHPGGIAFRVPGFDWRAVAVITDPRMATKLYSMELAGIRCACYLMLTEEGWILSARFKYKEGMVERRTKRGYATWYRPARQRWKVAPEGWPRDHRGSPLSTATIARRVARGVLPLDTVGVPPSVVARLTKERLARDSNGSGHPEHTGGTNR